MIPLLVLIYGAGFRNVFDNLFLYPVVITNPARKFPWSTLSPYLTHLLEFLFVAAIVNIIAGFRALRGNSTSSFNRLFVAVAILALATTHQALQRTDAGHVTLSGFIALALFPVALAILLDYRFTTPVSLGRDLFLVTLSLLIMASLVPTVVRTLRRTLEIGGQLRSDDIIAVQHGGRTFPLSSISAAREIGALLDQVTRLSSPGERLFVGPADLRRTNYNNTFLYHLLPQLTPATYFLEMNPLSANRPGSRLSADILSADLLILDHRLDKWNEPNESSRFGSEAPNQVVQSQFALQSRVGPYEVYRKK